MPLNQQIHLVSRPQGEATAANFSLVTTDTPELQDAQVLVRHHYLSLDPYMRGRMNDAKSYTAPQALGQTMGGGPVGEVFANGGRRTKGMLNYWSLPGTNRAVGNKYLTVPLKAALGTSLGRNISPRQWEGRYKAKLRPLLVDLRDA